MNICTKLLLYFVASLLIGAGLTTAYGLVKLGITILREIL